MVQDAQVKMQSVASSEQWKADISELVENGLSAWGGGESWYLMRNTNSIFTTRLAQIQENEAVEEAERPWRCGAGETVMTSKFMVKIVINQRWCQSQERPWRKQKRKTENEQAPSKWGQLLGTEHANALTFGLEHSGQIREQEAQGRGEFYSNTKVIWINWLTLQDLDIYRHNINF